MKIILLSGGSGQRLWPLSNNGRSKQFLKLLKNEENSSLESMFQRTSRKLGKLDLLNNAYIATNTSQVDILINQMDTDIPLIVEPERRDTFPAIALAASYLYTVDHVDRDEVIIVCPIDSFAEDNYYNEFFELAEQLELSGAEIGLLGVKPTYPSTKYGYIVPGETLGGFVKVNEFKEKPSEMAAHKLIEKNALWNCGVFAFKLGYLIDILQNKYFTSNYYGILENYNNLPKISFDYEVVENANDIISVVYDGPWKDLGTWNTLTEEMSSNLIGKAYLSSDSNNTHIVNELDIPIKGLALSNLIIAASPDGILISEKAESHRLKEILQGYDHRPMFEERRWGWYRVLDYTKIQGGQEVLTKRIGVYAGKNLSYQYHHKRSEVWTIISGIGEFVLNGEVRQVQPGDVLNIPILAKHAIKAITDLEFIEVQMGTELIEEDIIRLSMEWGQFIDKEIVVNEL